MMRSMYSAVSSMKAHQTRMDVVANNIANVNTIAFKGSRASFKETFNQTVRGASGPQDGGLGGTNPMQIGLGADIASIEVRQTQGAPERTDNPTDMMISGDGFFMVGSTADGTNRMYTRAGNFTMDKQGNLLTQDGYYVLGYTADENGNLNGSIGSLKIDKNAFSEPKQSINSNFKGNLNAETKSLGDLNAEKEPDLVLPPGGNEVKVSDLKYTTKSGKEESIIARDTTVSVYDSLGGKHDIRIAFVKNDTNEMSAYVVTQNAAGEDILGAEPIADFTFENGKLTTITPEDPTIRISGDPADENAILPNGAAAFSVNLDFSSITQFASQSTVSGDTDGFPKGGLDSFSVSPKGEIIGNFSNGKNRVLGRVAIANFDNPTGLQKAGSNMYTETQNSGVPVVGMPGQDGFPQVLAGQVEMSNVDLGTEFTTMITTQRGFQANSRVISTTDQLLEELVNLKR